MRLILLTAAVFVFLLELSSCKHCSTCYYLNQDTLSGSIDSVIFPQACGKKREVEEYEDSSAAAGVAIGKTVTCIRE